MRKWLGNAEPEGDEVLGLSVPSSDDEIGTETLAFEVLGGDLGGSTVTAGDNCNGVMGPVEMGRFPAVADGEGYAARVPFAT